MSDNLTPGSNKGKAQVNLSYSEVVAITGALKCYKEIIEKEKKLIKAFDIVADDMLNTVDPLIKKFERKEEETLRKIIKKGCDFNE